MRRPSKSCRHMVPRGINRRPGHGVMLIQLPPSDMKGFLVAMHMLVKNSECSVPAAQRQGPPAPFLVQNDLAAFDLRLVAVSDAANAPDGPLRAEPAVIRPENGARLLELGPSRTRIPVNQRNVVRVQQQNFLEGRMEHGVGLEFPAVQPSRGMPLSDF